MDEFLCLDNCLEALQYFRRHAKRILAVGRSSYQLISSSSSHELLVGKNQLKIALTTVSELLAFLGPSGILISDGPGSIAVKVVQIYLS